MFNVTKNGENRLDIEMSGRMDTEEMKRALEELTAKSSGIEHGRMLYRVIDFQIPTAGPASLDVFDVAGRRVARCDLQEMLQELPALHGLPGVTADQGEAQAQQGLRLVGVDFERAAERARGA